MTAQPISSVPSASKVPSAPSWSGDGVGAFISHLGGDTTSQSSVATIGTSSEQAQAWHKASKTHAANDSNPTSTSATAQVAALAQPVQASSTLPSKLKPEAASNPAGTGSNTPHPPASALPSSGVASNATPGAANLGLASSGKSLLGAFSSLLNAGTTISPLGRTGGATDLSGKPITASLTTNNVSLPTSLLAQVQRSVGHASANAMPSPLPPGTATTQQAGQTGATFVTNQFGAAGATATSAPAIAAALEAAAAQQAKQSAGSPSTPANATTNVATLPGAAALNARIVASATNLSVHPNQAATPSSAALTQLQDPNAGAIPPTKGAPGISAKPGSDAGIGAPAANGPLTGANPASDPRSFAAAIQRDPLVSRDIHAGKSSNDASPQSGGSSSNGGPASSATSLLAASTSANTSAPAPAPTGTIPHPGMIALPASEQVAINMRQALKAGANEIQIQLKPDSLGVIDVKLKVDHDGRLSAVISANHPETLNLLKHDSSSLQQSLRDAGFNADGSSLSFNLSGDSQSFAQNTGQESGSGAPLLPSALGAAALGSAAPARAARQHLGALDIHV